LAKGSRVGDLFQGVFRAARLRVAVPKTQGQNSEIYVVYDSDSAYQYDIHRSAGRWLTGPCFGANFRFQIHEQPHAPITERMYGGDLVTLG